MVPEAGSLSVSFFLNLSQNLISSLSLLLREGSTPVGWGRGMLVAFSHCYLRELCDIYIYIYIYTSYISYRYIKLYIYVALRAKLKLSCCCHNCKSFMAQNFYVLYVVLRPAFDQWNFVIAPPPPSVASASRLPWKVLCRLHFAKRTLSQSLLLWPSFCPFILRESPAFTGGNQLKVEDGEKQEDRWGGQGCQVGLFVANYDKFGLF